MSIQDLLAEHVEGKRIVHVTPPFGPQVREVYATVEVYQQLDHVTADERFRGSAGQLRGWLDNFARGNRIVVGDKKSKTVDMKQLECAGDVWEIRKRQTPSTRIFGYFLEPDAFLALGVHLTSDLFLDAGEIRNWFGQKIRDYLPNWDREIRNCKSEWRRLFHTFQPHTAETVSGYLSFASHERDL